MWSYFIFIVLHTIHTIAWDSSKKISHICAYVNLGISLEIPNRDFVRRQGVFIHIYSKAFPML